jgi:hypothetical protein
VGVRGTVEANRDGLTDGDPVEVASREAKFDPHPGRFVADHEDGLARADHLTWLGETFQYDTIAVGCNGGGLEVPVEATDLGGCDHASGLSILARAAR